MGAVHATRTAATRRIYREDGKVEQIRESDGLHFNADGYTILVRDVAELAAEEFGLDPSHVRES